MVNAKKKGEMFLSKPNPPIEPEELAETEEVEETDQMETSKEKDEKTTFEFINPTDPEPLNPKQA